MIVSLSLSDRVHSREFFSFASCLFSRSALSRAKNEYDTRSTAPRTNSRLSGSNEPGLIQVRRQRALSTAVFSTRLKGREREREKDREKERKKRERESATTVHYARPDFQTLEVPGLDDNPWNVEVHSTRRMHQGRRRIERCLQSRCRDIEDPSLLYSTDKDKCDT